MIIAGNPSAFSEPIEFRSGALGVDSGSKTKNHRFIPPLPYNPTVCDHRVWTGFTLGPTFSITVKPTETYCFCGAENDAE